MKTTKPPLIEDARVAEVFAGYPGRTREKLLVLRCLILETAADTPGVGGLQETLKWGQPSYLTAESKSGTTVRIGPYGSSGSKHALYVHCQSDTEAGAGDPAGLG